MKTPEQVLADVTRRLSRTWPAASLEEPEAGWPHAFPIGQPTSHQLTSTFAEAAARASAWRDWARRHNVSLRYKARRVHGTPQELPSHLVIPDADTAARLVGADWAARLDRGRRRGATLSSRYPHLTEPARTLAALDQLSDVDFDVLCRAADWFATNDATGLTPRQVPIAGMHAKWLDARQHLVRELAGVEDLRLLPPHPARIHFTYLDPEHRASGRRLHDSATVGDRPALAYTPRVIVISENKDTAIGFPEVPGGVAIEGEGRGGGAIASFDWVTSAQAVFYWGDMDADGLEILDGFRAAGVPATSLLMDLPAYLEWEQYGTNSDPRGNPLLPRAPRATPNLTSDEAELYQLLISPDHGGHRRVEQERIPLTVAVAEVRRQSPH